MPFKSWGRTRGKYLLGFEASYFLPNILDVNTVATDLPRNRIHTLLKASIFLSHFQENPVT